LIEQTFNCTDMRFRSVLGTAWHRPTAYNAQIEQSSRERQQCYSSFP